MDDCILWNGAKTKGGYGNRRIDGKNVYAHRFAWEDVNGKIPDNMTIDHLCKNKLCVNVDHLEVVTNRENVLRMRNWSEDSCDKGHTNITTRPSGTRVCRTCFNEYRKDWRKKKKLLEEAGY